MSCARGSSDSVASFTPGGAGLYWKLGLVFVISVFCLSLFVSGGNVIVRNGQLNVSAGIYSDSDTFYIDSENDRVGIGTTSPEAKLQISAGDILLDNDYRLKAKNASGGTSTLIGMAAVDDIVVGGSANFNNIRFYPGSGSEAVRVTSSGYVGIGTTTPDKKLHILESEVPDAAGHVYCPLVVEENDHTGINVLSNNVSEGYVIFGDQDDNAIGWVKYDHETDSMRFASNNSERVFIGATGNVGVGTTSPLAPLHVQGGSSNNLNTLAVFGQSTNTVMQMRLQQVSNGDGWGYYTFGLLGPGTTMDESGGITYDGNDPNYDFLTGIIFSSISGSTYFVNKKATYSGASRALSDVALLTIDGNDNSIGIGTTNPDQGKLQINSGSLGTNALLSLSTVDGTYNPRVIISHVTASNSQYLVFNSSYSTGTGYADWIFSNGDVGIGTTSPSRPLHVSSALDVVAKFTSTDAVTGIELNDTGGTVYIYGRSGNVGIDSSDPTEKLDVNGAIQLGTTASSCDSSHRGVMKFVTGDPDILYVCMKDSSTGYNWVIVARGD